MRLFFRCVCILIFTITGCTGIGPARPTQQIREATQRPRPPRSITKTPAPTMVPTPENLMEPSNIRVAAGDVRGLIAAIQDSNDEKSRPGVDTIVLQGGIYSIITAHPSGGEDGPTGLPSITSNIILIGNGAVIERSGRSRDEFRLLHIATGGHLALHQLTVRGGVMPSFPHGGGMLNRGTLEVINCTVSGNQNTGIYNAGGTVRLVNSTISGNEGILGGGIFNGQPWESQGEGVSIINSTITGNGAGFGGGIYNYVGSIEMINTIMAENVAQTLGGNCSGNPITSRGHNLDSDGSCSLDADGDISNMDAGIGPLQSINNLPALHPLLRDSLAINAGDDAICPETDQRGVQRPVGEHCDIGAYEFDR